MINTSKIPDFLRSGTKHQTITTANRCVLNRWSWMTVASYNAAVKKFNKFNSARNGARLKSNNKTTKIAWQFTYSDRTSLVQMTAECKLCI
ncbi:hypothetical protein PCASD_01455 [Puccinia coronata f. sp. avenae]|uniref:Uncharacterized protein n=1 Tax=Puccinia coronata f. sp. avenae TaxID=200324 RepID=A0A2N5SXM2_9BASI|nr:hypothetical protein PCASD_21798 [Puccinia coronata f. sp. avenae]PLW50542.1 hypothetical protein PCASD_01455 [Puccinia coronata f. sp. avenae]